MLLFPFHPLCVSTFVCLVSLCFLPSTLLPPPTLSPSVSSLLTTLPPLTLPSSLAFLCQWLVGFRPIQCFEYSMQTWDYVRSYRLWSHNFYFTRQRKKESRDYLCISKFSVFHDNSLQKRIYRYLLFGSLNWLVSSANGIIRPCWKIIRSQKFNFDYVL